MNKKVSLVIIQKPDIKISDKNFLLNKEGKVVRFENDQQDGHTPIEYYFVDEQPIQPSNQYVYYEEGPKKKTCTEIDSVNHFYANAGLVFVECIAPQIIN